MQLSGHKESDLSNVGELNDRFKKELRDEFKEHEFKFSAKKSEESVSIDKLLKHANSSLQKQQFAEIFKGEETVSAETKSYLSVMGVVSVAKEGIE